MRLTPRLVVERNAFDRNREVMRRVRDPLIGLRPHVKAHKCAEIARIQVVEDGAIGVTAATLAEVELIASVPEIRDVLLANELATVDSARRFVEIAAGRPETRFRVCVDSVVQIRLLTEAVEIASSDGGDVHNVGVLVEVNVGQNRCGCEPTEVVSLAKAVIDAGLQFDGLQCYNGMLQHVRDRQSRRESVMKTAVAGAKACKELLADAGIDCGIITGGGTGTFEFESESGVFTEIQPGSYIFMDVDYGSNADRLFESSLHVLSTIISVHPSRRWATIDAGTKAVSLDSGPPVVHLHAGDVGYRSGGDEHGILFPLREGEVLPEEFLVGSLVKLVPGHCDPTVNLYGRYFVECGDGKEEVWEIGGRH